MKKFPFILSLAAAVLAFSACKSQQQMLEDAEKVTVRCTPSPLCVKGGKVEADLAVTYPADYFDPKAILEVTPVIVYEGGEEVMEPIRYQGEKVKDNYRVVRTSGSVISQHVSFPYKVGMAKCHLELRSRCLLRKKWTDLPTKKVADGCNITETLADTRGTYTPKDHGYQSIIMLNPEGQVMYSINSAEVANSELKSQSIKDFKATLGEMTLNERTAITGIEIVAYASPEGNEKFNNKLSSNRSKSANKAFDKVTKDEELTGVRSKVQSVGEDWEGFQEMVAKSDLEDKDLILRVLSMYSDPKVREREIRNMSSIYRDLADDVLPQLRRARFIANVEYTNYTDDELKQLIRENLDILDEPALLKAASISKDNKDKKTLYRKAIEKYQSVKAEFNLACVALDEDDVELARQQIARCDAGDPDVMNLTGVCYLRDGNIGKAAEYFRKAIETVAKAADDKAWAEQTGDEGISKFDGAAGGADAVINQGLVAILEGRYSEAVVKCGIKGYNAALARLLAGRYDDVFAALGKDESPAANYLRAIAYTRKGEKSDAVVALSRATREDSTLESYSKNDIEFIALR